MQRWEYGKLLQARTEEFRKRISEGRRPAEDQYTPWTRGRPDEIRDRGFCEKRHVDTHWWKGPDGVLKEVTESGHDEIDYLTALGAEGWELVSAYSNLPVFYLKRPKSE